MSDWPEIYVLRHGQTEWNRQGRWQGDLDSPLTPEGQAQAEAMGRLLADLGVTPASHHFYTSPLGRARRTAALALAAQGTKGSAIEDARLREISVGRWTGRTRDEIVHESGLAADAHFLEFYAAAPGGESFAEIAGRAEAFLSGLAGPAVVVTHGITSRFLRLVALGWGMARLAELPGGQGVIHRVHAGRHEELAP
ncbi:MAG: histidine phosphatase family protein [Limimaricola sp.]|uniref:histidine phosphatase family protein n=1 Tax=Limimaricola sp. TaxID=2211665 RepID=UPI001D7972D1|nr:histidine phosphatase family protein [Limimaricola sp.]MBI1418417.1 histidine phosphatase family protein [Limimaricola sp.]